MLFVAELCHAQAFHMLFVILSGILLDLKLEIWPRMFKMARECHLFFIFEIISFFLLKILSSDAKLFDRRRVQFHILHAENFCSKLPKYLVNVTLFGLYFKHKTVK